MTSLLKRIEEMAEPLRAPTFVEAAKFILSLKTPYIVETGCYRGNNADGQSTAILALLAKETKGRFDSFDLHQHNIVIAQAHLNSLELNSPGVDVGFYMGDSAINLESIKFLVSFAYLDSYDFEEHKALDAQRHNLKEVEILLPKMADTSAILIDDCDLPLGGKGGLSVPTILAAGYKETATGYQRLFIRK